MSVAVTVTEYFPFSEISRASAVLWKVEEILNDAIHKYLKKKGPRRVQAHKTTLTLHTLGKESHTERDTTRCYVNLSFWLVALPFVVIIFTLLVLSIYIYIYPLWSLS